MTKKQIALIRGIRNNNPGNIEYNPSDKWQGLDTPLSDGRFCRFKSAPYGIRALARVLIAYQDKYGIKTIRAAFNRYAPPNENNTEAYINRICAAVGCGPNEEVDFHDYTILKSMVCGIIQHENGLTSYLEAYSDEQINKGLVLAGIEPSAPKPLSKTKTVQGAQVATGGVAGMALTDVLKQAADGAGQLEPLIQYSNWIKVAFLTLSILGIAMALWGRIRQRQQGIA